jgi:hypothetical protein
MQNTQTYSNSFSTLSKAVGYYKRKSHKYSTTLDNNKNNPEENCVAGHYLFEGNTNPDYLGTVKNLENREIGVFTDSFELLQKALAHSAKSKKYKLL